MMTADTAAKAHRRGRTGRMRTPLLYTICSRPALLLMAAPVPVDGAVRVQDETGPHGEPARVDPHRWTLDNFTALLDQLDMPRYFLNSLVVAVLVTVSNLLFCSMLGYALAKLDFTGRSKVFGVVLAALMVPGNLMLLPLFVLMSKLGLIDSYAGLVLPFAAGAFGVFLMRQFMQSDPRRTAGGGPHRRSGGVVHLLADRDAAGQARPRDADDLHLPRLLEQLHLAADRHQRPRQVHPAGGARHLRQRSQPTVGGSNGMLMAGSLLVVLPVLVVFAVLQRHFTQGIATAGLK